LSPLLANVYLHWFDHLFQRGDGPAHWAKAKLIRYADDFVVMARYISPQLRQWIEGKLEGWLGLQINRDKTRIVDLKQPDQVWTSWATPFGMTVTNTVGLSDTGTWNRRIKRWPGNGKRCES